MCNKSQQGCWSLFLHLFKVYIISRIYCLWFNFLATYTTTLAGTVAGRFTVFIFYCNIFSFKPDSRISYYQSTHQWLFLGKCKEATVSIHFTFLLWIRHLSRRKLFCRDCPTVSLVRIATKIIKQSLENGEWSMLGISKTFLLTTIMRLRRSLKYTQNCAFGRLMMD